MNIIDLGGIDRLVKRNSNLLTAFKVIDKIQAEIVVENIIRNVDEFACCKVIIHNNVLDIVSADGTVPISYYFADSYSYDDLKLILDEVKAHCQKSGIAFIE